MHKDDLMVPRDRFNNFFAGKPIDRVPILPMVASMSGNLIGMTHRERRSTPENHINAQVACYKRFGHDYIPMGYGLHGLGVALGSKVNNPENSAPSITKYILEDLDSISNLDFSDLDNAPPFQVCYEYINLVNEKLGDEVPIILSGAGPFTSVASIYKTEMLLRAVRKNPEKVHELLRLCTDVLKKVYVKFAKEGVIIMPCDPVASGTILSRQQYSEFVLPYTQELINAVHSNSAMAFYHVCGDTSNIMDLLADTGCDLLSIDDRVDLLYAKNKIGDRLPIAGNVDPVNVFMLGKEEDIEDNVKQCFEKAGDSPCGFVLASGCDIPQDVSVEKVDAFMRAGRKYGKKKV